jgi:hypothetical protein
MTAAERMDAMPPEADSIEQQLLGALMVDPQRIDAVNKIIGRDDFRTDRHRHLYEHLSNAPAEVVGDVALLTRWVMGAGDLNEIGGAPYLAEVAHSVTQPANAVYYAEIVRDTAIRRGLREQALLTAILAEDPKTDLSAVLERAEQVVEAARTTSRVNGHIGIRPLPKIQDAFDLCERDIPQPPELIQGILHQGSKLSFGGASKGFKTWTLDYLALAVAYELPWLGCETRRSKVLLIDLELQEAFCRRRLMKLADALGIQQKQGCLDVWNLRGFAVGHQLLLPQIEKRIADDGYGLVTIDPIYKLYAEGSSENAASDIASLMNGLERVCTSTGAAMTFGAHFSNLTVYWS